MYAMTRWLPAIVAVVLVTSFSACTFSSGDDEEGGGTITTTPVVAALQKAEGCDDLLEKIQADVIAKLDLEAKAMLTNAETTSGPSALRGDDGVTQGGTGGATGAAEPAAMEGSSNAAPAPSAAGGAAGAGGSYAADSAAPDTSGSGATLDGSGASKATESADSTPSGHSETTTQVEGVDEADIVKIDEESEHIYLLHGNELFVLNAWEPDQTAVESHLAVEGSPHEMFVRGDTAAVFSTVYDEQGVLSGGTGGAAGAAAVAPGGYCDMYGCYDYYGYSPFTKITLIDVSDTAAPEVVRELYLEGSYLSSRRHENIVRVVVQGGFKAPDFSADIAYYDPWGEPYSKAEIEAQVKAWHERMVADIKGSELSDWLPLELEREGDEIVEVEPACDAQGDFKKDYYAPSPGLTNYGMTNIFAFDLSDPSGPTGGAVILGEASEVYASEKMLLLAHNDWTWEERGFDHERTALHRFDLHADITTNYIASGFVQGHIKDQFSLDEYGGYIRVATELRSVDFMPLMVADGPVGAEVAVAGDQAAPVPFEPDQTPDNRVITLKRVEDDLVQTGITEALGKPGEEIKSVRFLGDVGYVVTFRNTDPLIAVDLSDPEAGDLPVLGELEISGFSDYMHPMDEDHLLTIGRNADPNTGRDIGLLLQIFDISDPAKPSLAHRYPYQQDGWSEANQQHKAFTYYGDRQLLAFPYAEYSYTFLSTLEVFRVTAEEGFTQLGSIDHTSLLTVTCPGLTYFDYYECGRPEPEVRRGVFITGDDDNDGTESDFVYSISYGGVMVHDLDDLTTPVAEVPLPAIDMYTYYGGGGVLVPMKEAAMPMDSAGEAGSGGSMGTAGASGGPADGGTAVVSVCGDGVMDPGEQCDGNDLGGETCETLGQGAGTLACDEECMLDISMCNPASAS